MSTQSEFRRIRTVCATHTALSDVFRLHHRCDYQILSCHSATEGTPGQVALLVKMSDHYDVPVDVIASVYRCPSLERCIAQSCASHFSNVGNRDFGLYAHGHTTS